MPRKKKAYVKKRKRSTKKASRKVYAKKRKTTQKTTASYKRHMGSYKTRKPAYYDSYGRDRGSKQVARTKFVGNGCRVRHCEFLDDVITQGVSYSNNGIWIINPGNPDTFPWLSSIAGNFEEYQFNSLKFMYRSTAGNAINSTNLALGVVIGTVDYNITHGAFSSKAQQDNFEGTVSSKPSANFTVPVLCKKKNNVLGRLYVSSETTVAQVTALNTIAQDPRFKHLGGFQIGTSGFQAATTVGELWVEYDVSLYKPATNLVSALSGYFPGYSHFSWPSTAASQPLAGVGVNKPWGTQTAALLSDPRDGTIKASGLLTTNTSMGSNWILPQANTSTLRFLQPSMNGTQMLVQIIWRLSTGGTQTASFAFTAGAFCGITAVDFSRQSVAVTNQLVPSGDDIVQNGGTVSATVGITLSGPVGSSDAILNCVPAAGFLDAAGMVVNCVDLIVQLIPGPGLTSAGESSVVKGLVEKYADEDFELYEMKKWFKAKKGKLLTEDIDMTPVSEKREKKERKHHDKGDEKGFDQEGEWEMSDTELEDMSKAQRLSAASTRTARMMRVDPSSRRPSTPPPTPSTSNGREKSQEPRTSSLK